MKKDANTEYYARSRSRGDSSFGWVAAAKRFKREQGVTTELAPIVNFLVGLKGYLLGVFERDCRRKMADRMVV